MKRPLSYLQFLKAIAGYDIHDIEDIIKDASRSFQLFPEYQSYARRYSGAYMVVYPLRKYIYADDNLARLVGASIYDIKENGIGNGEPIFYAPDDKIHSEKVFANNLETLKDIPVAEHKNYLMSCNFRVYNKHRDLRNMLQESYFIKSAPNGMPLVALGFITDISHIRNDNRIGHGIYNDQGEIYSNNYYAQEGNEKLSIRQIEIIKLICNGLTTKEIGKRLSISDKTVDNHKQNIRKVINTRNVAEVINYAITHGIIA